jgi:hypothetical protein
MLWSVVTVYQELTAKLALPVFITCGICAIVSWLLGIAERKFD